MLFLAVALLPAPAFAQPAAGSVFQESCPTCGVVRSVKRVESEPRPTMAEREAAGGHAGSNPLGGTGSGLVANVPLGGGGSTLGSSSDLRREAKPAMVSYEIVVRLDDGRLQLVRQDDPHGLREGDKVRIEEGKAVLRSR
jgi:outer membrane lipoprotein SlyB